VNETPLPITDYLDHIEDLTWIESLIDAHGLDRVLRACARVFASSDADSIHAVAIFVRDIGIHGIVRANLVTRARRQIPRTVLPSLRRLLRARFYRVRSEAIYTLGKLSFRSEAKSLRRAFPFYLTRDPMNVPRVLFELTWLGGLKAVEACLRRVVAHPNALVRWSALGYAWQSGVQRAHWLEKLSEDRDARVRAEARSLLAGTDEKVTFWALEASFSTFMTRRDDYTLADLGQFAQRWEKSMRLPTNKAVAVRHHRRRRPQR
jgi:HEAT repeat protein